MSSGSALHTSHTMLVVAVGLITTALETNEPILTQSPTATVIDTNTH